MRQIIKIISILLATTIFLSANSIEEKAFNAYKRGDYRSAIKLYTKSAKNKNLKAYLMLALFYEKGIGVEQNRLQAIKFYKYILKRSSNLKRIVSRKDIKKVNITIAALERLAVLENSRKYLRLAKKLQEFKKNIDISKTELFDSTNSENDYLILCPNAEIIPPEDREGIEEFDCALFEYFPKKMVKFMRLRRLRFKVLKMPVEKGLKVFNKLEKQIAEVRKPLIEYLQQEVVNCYNIARDINGIHSCDYDYLLKTDPLLFKNRAYNMEQYVLHHNFKNRDLTKKDKEILIDNLIKKISDGTYLKKYENMVK